MGNWVGKEATKAPREVITKKLNAGASGGEVTDMDSEKDSGGESGATLKAGRNTAGSDDDTSYGSSGSERAKESRKASSQPDTGSISSEGEGVNAALKAELDWKHKAT